MTAYTEAEVQERLSEIEQLANYAEHQRRVTDSYLRTATARVTGGGFVLLYDLAASARESADEARIKADMAGMAVADLALDGTHPKATAEARKLGARADDQAKAARATSDALARLAARARVAS